MPTSSITHTYVADNSSSPSFSDFDHCLDTKAGVAIVTAFLVTRFLLLLPLSTFVLHLGVRRWRRGRAASHSDVFTYHSAVMELVYALGTACYFCGQHAGLVGVMKMGYYLCTFVLPGQTSLHILTCAERYLAVVHPVVYLRLRQSEGVRVRGVSTGCVWLLCVAWIGLAALYSPEAPHVPYFCILLLFLVVVSFCSVSVLRALTRPGPGDPGGSRERADRSKRRALHTIAAITAVLWLYFVGFLVCAVVDNLHVLGDGCLVLMCGYWFALPTSLVLPLLFLWRVRQLL